MLSFMLTINGSYSDLTFSVIISSIWWFEYFISITWGCLIVVSIRTEVEQGRVIEWFIDRKYILYKCFVLRFQNMVGFE